MQITKSDKTAQKMSLLAQDGRFIDFRHEQEILTVVRGMAELAKQKARLSPFVAFGWLKKERRGLTIVIEADCLNGTETTRW